MSTHTQSLQYMTCTYSLPLQSIPRGSQQPSSKASSAAAALPAGLLSLEAVLLSLNPVEVVVVPPLSAATRRLLDSYRAAAPSAGGGCREELAGSCWGPDCSRQALDDKLAPMYQGV
jgi:hypothetical protein